MKYDLSKTPTRAAQRTLDAFRGEIFRLLAEKPFEDVSARELCEGANYPRATFYNYFDDKYDLLNYCWIWLAQQIRFDEYRHMPRNEMLYVFFDRIFDYATANAEAIRRILARNSEEGYLFSSFRTFMDQRVRETFRSCPDAQAAPVPAALLADHYSQTLLLVWRWSMAAGQGCQKAEARGYLRYLIGDGRD